MIQIFGKAKCSDTRKAERFFKERGIPFQRVDLTQKGMSRGELLSVKEALGLEALVDPKAKNAPLVKYLAGEEAKVEKLLEDPTLLRTPILRRGREAAVGYAPEVWAEWAGQEKKTR